MRNQLYVLIVSLCYACASIQAPQGGPKDTTRPQLLSANPTSGTTNFKGKSIILEFNEDVSEHNQKQLIISPRTPTTVTPGTKKLKITADSGFRENTTYAIVLQKKIKDNREGNLLSDTNLVFTTGSTLDTCSLEINTLDISHKPEQKKILATLKNGNNQLYFASADSLRLLSITSIPRGKYALEVYKDGNENYQYGEEDGHLYVDTIFIEGTSKQTVTPLPQKYKEIKIFKQIRKDTISLEATGPISLTDPIRQNIIYRTPKRDIYRIYPYKGPLILNYLDTLGNKLTDTLNNVKLDSTRSLSILQNGKTVSTRMDQKKLWVKQTFDWNLSIIPKRTEVNQDSVWTKVDPKFDANSIEISLPKANPGKVKIRYDTICFYNRKGYTIDSVVIEKTDLQPQGEISGTIVANLNKGIVTELLSEKNEFIGAAKGKIFVFHVKPGKYQLQVYQDVNDDGMYTGGNKIRERKAEPLYKLDNPIDLKPGWDIENLTITPGF